MPQRTQHVYRVVITSHAKERWRERGGVGKLTVKLVRDRLMGALGCGVEYVDSAVEINLGCGLKAVCVPDPSGVWIVVTVAGSRNTGEEAG